jgi:hypothetical protein
VTVVKSKGFTVVEMDGKFGFHGGQGEAVTKGLRSNLGKRERELRLVWFGAELVWERKRERELKRDRFGYRIGLEQNLFFWHLWFGLALNSELNLW